MNGHRQPLKGYLHPAYAASLAEFGTPWHLPASGGSVLIRPIPGTVLFDAMGCYPLFGCRDWRGLQQDVRNLASDVVTLSLVADPLGDYEVQDLKDIFSIVAPFKDHFLIDLSKPIGAHYSHHHRRAVTRSLRAVRVEHWPDPRPLLDEWVTLYSGLAERYQLTGLKAFSVSAFQQQFEVPGLVVFRATHAGALVGMHLWFEQDDIGFGHLGVTNDLGHRLSASYAMYATAIEWFAPRLRWLDLGGVPGARRSDASGLLDFKRGWATDVRTAHFCGVVFDQAAYDALTFARPGGDGTYFPAYRHGELG